MSKIARSDPGEFQVATLTNGVKLFFKQAEPHYSQPKIAGVVLVSAGARDDPSGKEGCAHFFEHMPFRGTKKYPSLQDLTLPIENNGGYINAFTNSEYTGYEVIVPAPLIEEGISRLADMLLTPSLKASDIDIERDVIIQELKNKQANVGWFATEELYKRVLGKQHPVYTTTIGTKQSLTSITGDDLAKFHTAHYNAATIRLVFAGSVHPRELIKLCERYFADVTNGQSPPRDFPFQSPKLAKKTVTLRPDRYNRSLFVVGRAFPALSKHDGLVLGLGRDMLTRGLNSPLLRAIRDERGLAYNVTMAQNDFADVSVLSASVGTDYKRMNEVETIFWNVVDSTIADRRRFDEVKHAKIQALLHNEYNTAGLVDYAVDDLMDYGEISPLADYVDIVNSITFDDVFDAMTKTMKREEFVTLKIDCDSKA